MFISVNVFQSSSKTDPSSNADKLPLCQIKDFLSGCVFPDLSHLLGLDSADYFTTLAASILSLLTVAIESFDRLLSSELFDCEPVALVFCLCQVVEICRASCAAGSVDMLSTKDMAVKALGTLVKILTKYSIPGELSLIEPHHNY